MFKKWLESFAPEGDIEKWVMPDQKNAHLMGINTNDDAARWLRKRDNELGVNANPKTRSDAYARVKPQKPYPSFPLTANGNGKWSKKIGGKVFYFGPWEDPNGALEKWLDVKDDLLAGREARRTPSIWERISKQPAPTMAGTERMAPATAGRTVKLYDKTGSGRKECPQCHKYVGSRAVVCLCGHNFKNSAEPKSISEPNPSNTWDTLNWDDLPPVARSVAQSSPQDLPPVARSTAQNPYSWDDFLQRKRAS